MCSKIAQKGSLAKQIISPYCTKPVCCQIAGEKSWLNNNNKQNNRCKTAMLGVKIKLAT